MKFERLADTATFINGKAFKPEDWKSDGLPIIRIQNLTGTSEVFNYFEGNIEEKYIVRKGDLLISWSASLGIYEWGREDSVLNQHIFKVKLNKNVDKKYFYYTVYTRLEEMESHVHGSTMKHITKARFDNIKIPLPDLQTQKQIASILETADCIRQQRKDANALTEQFLKSSFLHLFGDLVLNTKEWPFKRLDEVATVSSGVTKGRSLIGAETITVPYMRVANVQDGFLDLSEIKTIEIKSYELNKYLLQDGDILLTEGGDPDKLGRGAVWQNQIENCIHQNHIFKVRADRTIFTPAFLSLQFGSDYGKQYFLKAAKQTTGIASINSTQLKAFPVLIPPLSLQQHFASLVADTERLRRKQQQSEKGLEQLFQALLHKYFNSQLYTQADEPQLMAAEPDEFYETTFHTS